MNNSFLVVDSFRTLANNWFLMRLSFMHWQELEELNTVFKPITKSSTALLSTPSLRKNRNRSNISFELPEQYSSIFCRKVIGLSRFSFLSNGNSRIMRRASSPWHCPTIAIGHSLDCENSLANTAKSSNLFFHTRRSSVDRLGWDIYLWVLEIILRTFWSYSASFGTRDFLASSDTVYGNVVPLFRIPLFSTSILPLDRYRAFPLSQAKTTRVQRHTKLD